MENVKIWIGHDYFVALPANVDTGSAIIEGAPEADGLLLTTHYTGDPWIGDDDSIRPPVHLCFLQSPAVHR